jgi:mono/diheme cytochrome c family protein
MKRWIAILGFAAALGACNGSTATDASCAVSTPATCPTTQPSYAADVAPVLETYCVSCHQAGGSEAGKPLDTYRSAVSLGSSVENVVAGCTMPPSSDAQPTAAQREAVLTWILCGAPNN